MAKVRALLMPVKPADVASWARTLNGVLVEDGDRSSLFPYLQSGMDYSTWDLSVRRLVDDLYIFYSDAKNDDSTLARTRCILDYELRRRVYSGPIVIVRLDRGRNFTDITEQDVERIYERVLCDG